MGDKVRFVTVWKNRGLCDWQDKDRRSPQQQKTKTRVKQGDTGEIGRDRVRMDESEEIKIQSRQQPRNSSHSASLAAITPVTVNVKCK